MLVRQRSLRIAGAVAAALCALLASAWLLCRSDGGHRLIERAVARVSDGAIVVRGLAGRLPGELRIAHVELHDRDGVWASANDVAIEWSPAALLSRHLKIARLAIATARVDRRPLSDPRSTEGALGSNPIRCSDVAAATLERLTVGPAIAGRPAEFAARGHVTRVCRSQGTGWLGVVSLSVEQLGEPGRYALAGSADATGVAARVTIAEAAGGPLAATLGVPGLGEISLDAAIDGRRAAERLRLAMHAGQLQADLAGTINLDTLAASLDVHASAPAMAPSASLSWQGIELQGRWRGELRSPATSFHAAIDGLRAGGAEFQDSTVSLSGDGGQLSLSGRMAGVRLPAPFAPLSRDGSIELQASANLNDADRPVRFRIAHPLLVASGELATRNGIKGSVDLSAPDVRPFAAIAGVSVDGEAVLRGTFATRDGAVGVTVGGSLTGRTTDSWLSALIGVGGNVRFDATLRRDGVTIERAEFSSQKAIVSLAGSEHGGRVDGHWALELSDLAALSPALGGHASGAGRIGGTWPALTASAEATGEIAVKGGPLGHVTLAAHAEGLPDQPFGAAEVRAVLDGDPLRLDANVERRSDGRLSAVIAHAAWRRARLDADVVLAPGGNALRGQVRLQEPVLADFAPLLGDALAGSVSGEMTFIPDRQVANVSLHGENVRYGSLGCEHLGISGEVTRTHDDTTLALVADARHAHVGNAAADLQLTAVGPARLPRLRLLATFDAGGSDGRLAAAATLDAQSRILDLTSLAGKFGVQSANLAAPARIHFADGVTVENLRFDSGSAVITLAGRFLPGLDATASIRGLSAAQMGALTDTRLEGTINADIALTGPYTAVQGSAHLSAERLRAASGPGRRVPPASVQVAALLDGSSAHVQVDASAGSSLRLMAHGTVPFAADAGLDMRITGDADLGIVSSFLEAGGRRMRGHLVADASVAGTRLDPRPSGKVRIEHGDIDDFTLGVHLSEVSGDVEADGRSIRVGPVLANVGAGTISVSGAIDLADASLPIKLAISGHDARLLTSDLITATMDLNVAVRGALRSQVAIAGRVHVNRADITIPGAFPPDVVVLDVRRPGAKLSPQRRALFETVGLDVSVDAASAVFVRGRGLDAELAGELHIAGTVGEPAVSGGFDLRDGTFNLGGAPLHFTSGRVSFNGRGIRKGFDPTLDFIATSAVAGLTATVAIGGYADAPSITLSSVPEAPQDEILSRILFGQGVTQLTALQVAQIGAALASISGLGGGSLNPISALQRTLGLDRLSVSSTGGTTSSGTSIEAGRYASSRVFVGARQNTAGGTQALVQIDLTKHLKIQTALGPGSNVAQGATPENDPGNTIGLSYQIEY
jgi:translocation and assembly module TamB